MHHIMHVRMIGLTNLLGGHYQFFTMGKMLISSKYIIWKISPLPNSTETHPIHIFNFIYYNNNILYFR
jgi:hypothetical protein